MSDNQPVEVELFSGEIGPGMGTRVILGRILSAETVQNSLLRIVSRQARGHIGIFCNKFITGAHEGKRDEYGLAALRELLGCTSGKFSVFKLAAQREYLVQNLALPIDQLLAWRNPKNTDVAPSLTEAVDAQGVNVSGVFVSQEWKLEQLNESLLTTSVSVRRSRKRTYHAWGGELPVSTSELLALNARNSESVRELLRKVHEEVTRSLG